MGQENLEIALIKYNKKTWCKSAILGFFIGLAVIVPGVSGSTVAIILKLYDQFLYALGNVFKKFKACIVFLLPIGIGAVVGVLLGFIAVQQLLELIPFAIVCLFAGLMSGAFPAVKDELKGATFTAKRGILFAVGLCIPVALGCLSAILSEGSGGAFDNLQAWQIIVGVLVGIVVGLTQVAPGLSASAFLMALGWYKSLTESVHMSYWKGNPQIFLLYAALGIGFLIGVLGFSKLMTNVFAKARHTAYSMIVGLSLGSILSMFCNGDTVAVYKSWFAQGAKHSAVFLDVGLGVVLFVIGVVGAYALVRYQRKKDAEAAEKLTEETTAKTDEK